MKSQVIAGLLLLKFKLRENLLNNYYRTEKLIAKLETKPSISVKLSI